MFAQTADSTKQQKKVRITPLPALFYTPETRLGYGALVSAIFNTGDTSNTRNSNMEVLGAYTQEKQIIARTSHTIFLPSESYIFNGNISYYDFPIFYYGIGNDTKDEHEEKLRYQVVEVRERVVKNLGNHVFVGGQYQYVNLYDLTYEPEILIEDKPMLESQAGVNSGMGLAFIYDSRDVVINAYQGAFLNISTFHYQPVFGSKFTYNSLRVDARKYWKLTEKGVLAGQFLGEFNSSNVPFRQMALLGGDMIMRGFYNGRYRDNQQMAIQAEWRQGVLPWLGFTVFGATGDVSDRFSNFAPADFKWAAGAGLRLTVNKKDRANVRIDYGIGKGTSGFYFAFTEAF